MAVRLKMYSTPLIRPARSEPKGQVRKTLPKRPRFQYGGRSIRTAWSATDPQGYRSSPSGTKRFISRCAVVVVGPAGAVLSEVRR